MVEKVALGELVRLIQSGSLTKERIADYFEPDTTKSTGFQIVFKLRPDTVDVTGVEHAAYAAGNELALDAARSAQRKQLIEAVAAYALIAEGDSWFFHPLNWSAIDLLQGDGFSIHNMAWPGRTLEDMIATKRYLRDLSNGSVTHFFFSGGGNDVIGELSGSVKPFDPSRSDPENNADVEYYIRDEFHTRVLPRIESLYLQLLSDIQSVSPRTKLFVHGYAHARPIAFGWELGSQFGALRFDLQTMERKALAWRIVTKMIDAFNAFLQSLATRMPKQVQYFDFRPVVRETLGPVGHRTFGVAADWFDEIHPSPSAAARMATKYKEALAQA